MRRKGENRPNVVFNICIRLQRPRMQRNCTLYDRTIPAFPRNDQCPRGGTWSPRTSSLHSPLRRDGENDRQCACFPQRHNDVDVERNLSSSSLPPPFARPFARWGLIRSWTGPARVRRRRRSKTITWQSSHPSFAAKVVKSRVMHFR